MDYMTLKEASEKWGVTTRWINYLCTKEILRLFQNIHYCICHFFAVPYWQ